MESSLLPITKNQHNPITKLSYRPYTKMFRTDANLRHVDTVNAGCIHSGTVAHDFGSNRSERINTDGIPVFRPKRKCLPFENVRVVFSVKGARAQVGQRLISNNESILIDFLLSTLFLLRISWIAAISRFETCSGTGYAKFTKKNIHS